MRSKRTTTHWIRRAHLFKPDEYVWAVCGTSRGKAYKTCPSCCAIMRSSKYDPSWVDGAESLSAMLDEDW